MVDLMTQQTNQQLQNSRLQTSSVFKNDNQEQVVKPSTTHFSDMMRQAQQAKNAQPSGASVVTTAASAKTGKTMLTVAPNGNSATTGVAATPSTSSSSTSQTSSASALLDSDGSDSTLVNETANLMEMNQGFNLQYLQIQESMQNQTRQFESVSNYSKGENDIAKNSLGNVR